MNSTVKSVFEKNECSNITLGFLDKVVELTDSFETRQKGKLVAVFLHSVIKVL